MDTTLDNSVGMDVAFSGFIIIFILFFLALSIGMYVINALALMRIAKNRGSDKGWFAWIPILNTLLIPMLVEDDVNSALRGKFTLIVGILLVTSIIPFIGFVGSIGYLILYYYGFFTLIKQYSSNYIAHFVVVVITFGFTAPISLFYVRNREPEKVQVNN